MAQSWLWGSQIIVEKKSLLSQEKASGESKESKSSIENAYFQLQITVEAV